MGKAKQLKLKFTDLKDGLLEDLLDERDKLKEKRSKLNVEVAELTAKIKENHSTILKHIETKKIAQGRYYVGQFKGRVYIGNKRVGKIPPEKRKELNEEYISKEPQLKFSFKREA